MDKKNELGYAALGGDWQKIEAYSAEEYAKDLAAELKLLGETLEQFNITADTKLPSTKKMLLNIINQVAGTRSHIEGLIDMNKVSGRKISDLVQ